MGSIISQLVGYAHDTQLEKLKQQAELDRAVAVSNEFDEPTRYAAAERVFNLNKKIDTHGSKKQKMMADAETHQNILNNYLSGGNAPEGAAAAAHGALAKMLPDHVQDSFQHFGENALPSLGAQSPTPPPAPQLTGGNSAANPSVQALSAPPAQVAQAPQQQAPPPQMDLPPAPGNITAPNVSPTRSMPPSNIGSGPSAGFSVPNAPLPMQAPPGSTGSADSGFRFHPFTPEEHGQREAIAALPALVQKNMAERAQKEYFEQEARKLGLTDPVQIANYSIQKAAAYAPITNLRPGGKAVDHTGKVIATGGPRFITTPAGAVTTQVNPDNGQDQGLQAPPGADGQPSAQPLSSVLAAPPALLTPTERAAIRAFAAKNGVDEKDVSPRDYAQAVSEFKEASMSPTERATAEGAKARTASTLATQESARKTADINRQLASKRLSQLDVAGQYDDESIDAMAQQTLAGQKVTFPMGAGGNAVKAEVMNRVAQIIKERGNKNEELPAITAAIKADSTALGNLTKQAGMIESFADNTDRNFQLAIKLGDKVDRTNSPVVNRWLLKLKGQYQGDPNVTAFEAALNTAATDWAKVTTGQTSGQAVTDSARTKYDQMVSAALSGKSLRNLYTEAVLPELDNRKQSLDAERKKLISRISGKQPIAAPPASSIRMRAPNGQISTVPADQVDHYKQKGAVVVQ